MDLRQIFDVKYPIIQGGMARAATGEFAAAVSNAGGLGVVAAGGISADALREEIRKAKSLTDKPFGVNIMLMDSEAGNCASVAASEKVAFVTTGAGSPDEFIGLWKEAGVKVFPVVASCAMAKRAEKYGADGVIAEGCESGGHIGELTTMALVPQVINQVSILVIAAGGIVTGAQMAAALALGACGVQIGTALLASCECPIHDNYKQAILKAKDIDTTVTGRSGGSPVRCLKNPMSRKYIKMEKEGASREELERLTLSSLSLAVYNGDIKNGSLLSGQSAGLVKEIRPVSGILDEMFTGAVKRINELKTYS